MKGRASKKYTKKQKEEAFNRIIDEIVDENKAIRNILKEDWAPSTSTFFKWLEEDSSMNSRYGKATSIRTEMLFEEMMHIAFTPEEGETVEMSQKGEKGVKEMKKTKGDMLGHRRLKVDTIKWALSKLEPKKYGAKLDVTSDGQQIMSSEERERKIKELLEKANK